MLIFIHSFLFKLFLSFFFFFLNFFFKHECLYKRSNKDNKNKNKEKKESPSLFFLFSQLSPLLRPLCHTKKKKQKERKVEENEKWLTISNSSVHSANWVQYSYNLLSDFHLFIPYRFWEETNDSRLSFSKHIFYFCFLFFSAVFFQ